MRPIKFRGKRIDNGEWVYGYYAKVENRHFMVPEKSFVIHRPDNHFTGVFEVIPETVGQFINKTDKNDKEIYEADKVKADKWEFEVVWQGYGWGLKGILHGWWRSFHEFESIEVLEN